MAAILIIEDEAEMASGLKDTFEFDGHDIHIANNGKTGLDMALSNTYNLIILDVMLPEKSGFDVCKELRKTGDKTPIIMLTARQQEIDKVRGLELGADDYITKPFSVRELLARVKAVLRRYPENTHTDLKSIKIGELEIDFENYKAKSSNSKVDLSYKEFEILKFLFQHKNEVVSRDELLNKVWGYEIYPTSRTVDNFIAKIRKKIEKDPANPEHILTIYGIGYKLLE
ncbi:MAG: response regulator transcription factor [Deferribacteres bacterium]|nr:response regulator transcription factor [candidate division KSB1 bacterium]MCB9501760.1 response regulator transcription factor [Deferribacteres bacterium]